MSEPAGDPEVRPTRVEPPASAAGLPFWDGTRDRRFLVPWCLSCGWPHWFPREVCPQCLSPDLEWREALGAGTVYAVSVMPKPGNPLMAGRGPYAVGLVDLAEEVRVFTEIVGLDPEAVTVGMPVQIDWEPLSDGRNLPLFRVVPLGGFEDSVINLAQWTAPPAPAEGSSVEEQH